MTATSHLLRINVVGIQGARGINFGGPKKIHVCKRVANSNSLTPLLQRNLARMRFHSSTLCATMV